MPARRKRKVLITKRPKFGKKYLNLLLLVILFIFVAAFVLKRDKWNSNDKLSLVIKNNDGSLSIAVFDPELEEIYHIKIPDNSEIEVAGEYGIWKMRSLWDLGKQEGLAGQLMARSITLSWKLPIYAWAGGGALGFIEPGLKNSLLAIFSSYESNLSFGDKLGLLAFGVNVKNTKRITINLEETGFLERKRLSDGSDGYVVSKTPPQKVLAIFSESIFAADIARVSIRSSEEDVLLAEDVGGVIETLGGKVSSIEASGNYPGTCAIRVKDEKISEILKKIFDCEEVILDKENGFALELTLGDMFSEKY